MRTVWLVLALAAAGLPVRGAVGSAAGPVVTVDYSNPGLAPSHWTLTIHPDGSGHFRSERSVVAAGDKGNTQGNTRKNRQADIQESTQESAGRLDAPNVDRDVMVSAEFAERVFQTAREHKLFNMGCESHLKVAFQGWKKLSYSGPEGEGSCEFNYSKDKDIQALGDSLAAVAGTILEGARLETLLQYDRLGLDREMEYLVAAAGDGRVQQVSTIKEILQRLAEDPEVLERVRKRARVLLASAGNSGQ
jgi:hypothetical protein